MAENQSLELSKVVDRVLNRLYPSMAVQKRPAVKETWITALGDIEIRWIEAGIIPAVRSGQEQLQYHSFYNQYREICLQLKRNAEAREQAGDQEDAGEYIRDKEISTKEARAIQSNIARNVSPPKKIKVPKIDLNEYLAPVTGELKEVVAYGHVDIDHFKANCVNQFGKRPITVLHSHHRGVTRKPSFSDKTYFGKPYTTSIRCAENHGGQRQAPITVGVF